MQANLYEDASGPAAVFRNGVEITGTWSRNPLGQPTQLHLVDRRADHAAAGPHLGRARPDTVAVTVDPLNRGPQSR